MAASEDTQAAGRATARHGGQVSGHFHPVFFGCGSVAVTVLFKANTGIFQVAAVWGIGVPLAVNATRHLSCAHLNRAVPWPPWCSPGLSSR